MSGRVRLLCSASVFPSLKWEQPSLPLEGQIRSWQVVQTL